MPKETDVKISDDSRELKKGGEIGSLWRSRARPQEVICGIFQDSGDAALTCFQQVHRRFRARFWWEPVVCHTLLYDLQDFGDKQKDGQDQVSGRAAPCQGLQTEETILVVQERLFNLKLLTATKCVKAGFVVR